MKVLGIDVSSETIGISIIEDTVPYSIIFIDHIKPPKNDSIIESLYETKQIFLDKIKDLKFDRVVIEEISEHMSNKTTSKTILKLAVFNRMIGLCIKETFNIYPDFLNVLRARANIKHKDYVGALAKEDVPDALSHLIGFDFPHIYETISYRKKTKTVIATESYDRADAVAMAVAYLEMKSKNIPLKTIKPKKTKTKKTKPISTKPKIKRK